MPPVSSVDQDQPDKGGLRGVVVKSGNEELYDIVYDATRYLFMEKQGIEK